MLVLTYFFPLFIVVEHQFEIVVEKIKGLSVFGNAVWGETDCFVQYHFPFQRHLDSDYGPSEGKHFEDFSIKRVHVCLSEASVT